MKKLYMLSFLILLPLYTWASPQPHVQAKKIIATINIPIAFEMSFTYTMQEKEQQEAIVLQGKAWVQGTQYRLILEDQELISDGKTCWQYLKEAQEVHIQHAMDIHSSFSLVHVLRHYRKDYVPIALAPCLLDQQACDRITLQPKQRDAFIASLVFTVARKPKELKHIQAIDKEGTCHSLAILKLIPKKAIADHYFKFSPPPGEEIEVIDLR
jgi:outer membrane lipoprotein-sorting protein